MSDLPIGTFAQLFYNDALLQGLTEGEVKGKTEGKVETQKNIAIRLVKLGLKSDMIAEATALPVDEIEALRKELK